MPPLEFKVPTIPQPGNPMPFPIAAAAAGLGSVLNFFGQNKANKMAAEASRYNTDQTIAANKQMAREAYQRDVAMWNRANAYNDPKQQMQRLRDAGLNPMMAYGSGSVAGNTSTATPTSPVPQTEYQYQAPAYSPLDASGIVSMFQNLELGKAQIDNVKANTAATEQKTANDTIMGALLEIDKLYRDREKRAGLTKSEAEAAWANRQELMDWLNKSIDYLKKKQEKEQAEQLFPSQLDYVRGTVKKQDEEINLLKKNLGLTEEQITAIKYQNKLRAAGTYEGDTGQGYLLRLIAPYIEKFLNPDDPNAKNRNMSQKEQDDLARQIWEHLDKKKK